MSGKKKQSVELKPRKRVSNRNEVLEENNNNNNNNNNIHTILGTLKFLNFLIFTILAIYSVVSEYNFFSQYQFVNYNGAYCQKTNNSPPRYRLNKKENSNSEVVRLWVKHDLVYNFTRYQSQPIESTGMYIFGDANDKARGPWEGIFTEPGNIVILKEAENAPPVEAVVSLYALIAFFLCKLFVGSINHIISLYIVCKSWSNEYKESMKNIKVSCCGRNMMIHYYWYTAITLLTFITLFPLSWVVSWSYDREIYYIRTFAFNEVTMTDCNALTTLYPTLFKGTEISSIQKATGYEVPIMFNAGGGAMGISMIFPITCVCLMIFLLIGNILQLTRISSIREEDYDVKGSDKLLLILFGLAIVAAIINFPVMFVIYVGLYLRGEDFASFFTLNVENWFQFGTLNLSSLGAIAGTEVFLHVCLFCIARLWNRCEKR